MLNRDRDCLVNPEMSKYIQEQTNKWVKKYSDKYKKNNNTISINNNLYILSFVSLLSFLAGYKCKSFSLYIL
jgi:hypothetical protein